MISTSFMIGTGFMKCIPMTLSGRLVASAMCEIEMEEVLDARIVSGLQILSSSCKISVSILRISGTASTTKSQSAHALRSWRWKSEHGLRQHLLGSCGLLRRVWQGSFEWLQCLVDIGLVRCRSWSLCSLRSSDLCDSIPHLSCSEYGDVCAQLNSSAHRVGLCNLPKEDQTELCTRILGVRGSPTRI